MWCISSTKQQTHEGMEIILVDDASRARKNYDCARAPHMFLLKERAQSLNVIGAFLPQVESPHGAS